MEGTCDVTEMNGEIEFSIGEGGTVLDVSETCDVLRKVDDEVEVGTVVVEGAIDVVTVLDESGVVGKGVLDSCDDCCGSILVVVGEVEMAGLDVLIGEGNGSDDAEWLIRRRWYAKGVLGKSAEYILSSPVIKSTIVKLYLLGVSVVVNMRY